MMMGWDTDPSDPVGLDHADPVVNVVPAVVVGVVPVGLPWKKKVMDCSVPVKPMPVKKDHPDRHPDRAVAKVEDVVRVDRKNAVPAVSPVRAVDLRIAILLASRLDHRPLCTMTIFKEIGGKQSSTSAHRPSILMNVLLERCFN